MIINGKKIAESLKERLAVRIQVIGSTITPGLGILLIGNDPASELYVSLKEKMALSLGIHCRIVRLPKDTNQEEVAHTLEGLSGDQTIHGILIQIPLPEHISLTALAGYLDPAKDIDCIHPHNLTHLFLDEVGMVPPTALAVQRLIEEVDPLIEGKNIVVVGDGFFGRQIGAHLLNSNASVTFTHSRTKDLGGICRAADIIISVIGKPDIITRDMVTPTSIVIDVGVSRKQDVIVGDVSLEVREIARAVSPVPGGVGPVTVVSLMENVVAAAERSLTHGLQSL